MAPPVLLFDYGGSVNGEAGDARVVYSVGLLGPPATV
jgi:hypothetical protein